MKLPHRSTSYLKSGVATSRALSRQLSGFPGVKFKDIQLWMMIAVLVLAPLFFGSVDLFWIAV